MSFSHHDSRIIEGSNLESLVIRDEKPYYVGVCPGMMYEAIQVASEIAWIHFLIQQPPRRLDAEDPV